jgi:signal transduction histidine kinase/CheY-like chemotaxis protein
MSVLPLSLLAAIFAVVWLPVSTVASWTAATLVMMGADQLVCLFVLRHPESPRRNDWLLTLFTFAFVMVYGVLPLQLIAAGPVEATIAGCAIIGAVTLSITSEFVLSRRIAVASYAALFFIACVAMALGRFGRPVSLLQTSTEFASVTGFFFYALDHARHLRRTNHSLADALEESKRREAEAKSANDAKSMFLATMSHEIRTPLNGVLGMAHAMALGELPPLQQKQLAVIRDCGESLMQMLNEVLDLAKIEAGKLECEAIPFNLAEIVRNIEPSFALQAASKSLHFDVTIQPAARAIYRGDPLRIRQILNNLVSNALKFTETGSVKLLIDDTPQGLILIVSDTGIGIPEDRLHLLFQKFSQIDVSTTRLHGGTGLGLAICRELCELMGGSVTAESVLGKGSRFIVTLPLDRIDDTADDASSDTEPVIPDHLNALRVLVAEDNEVNRIVLAAFLSHIDVKPMLVQNGAEAVAAWKNAEWDLILMDMQMPVLDGLSATREIRAEEARINRQRTPIIALSANAMTHQIAHCQAAGMDSYLAKPIQSTELYELFSQVKRRTGQFTRPPGSHQPSMPVRSESPREPVPL